MAEYDIASRLERWENSDSHLVAASAIDTFMHSGKAFAMDMFWHEDSD